MKSDLLLPLGRQQNDNNANENRKSKTFYGKECHTEKSDNNNDNKHIRLGDDDSSSKSPIFKQVF